MRGLSGISQGQHKGRETGGAPDTRPIFPVGSSLRSQMARQSEVSLSHTALGRSGSPEGGACSKARSLPLQAFARL